MGAKAYKVERKLNKIKVLTNKTTVIGDHVVVGTTLPAMAQIKGLKEFINNDLLYSLPPFRCKFV